MICRYWIVLDSESTNNTVKDKDILINIWEVKLGDEMWFFTNGGYQVSDIVGGFQGYGTVWFNQTSTASILSLARVLRSRRVTMDTGVEKINVYKSDGTLQK